jgi:hypothetical protein
VDYSLFMVVMMVLTLERVEKQPEATPVAFPHSIFAGTISGSVFHVSLLPLAAIVQEGIYRRLRSS